MSKSTARALGASTLAAFTLVAAACGGGSSGGGGGGNTGGGQAAAEAVDPADANVTIVNFGYEDAEYTTAVGEPVLWVNTGAAPHTVTGDDFDSRIIRTGTGWEHTFTEPGTYEYWCTNHETMRGTIVVE